MQKTQKNFLCFIDTGSRNFASIARSRSLFRYKGIVPGAQLELRPTLAALLSY